MNNQHISAPKCSAGYAAVTRIARRPRPVCHLVAAFSFAFDLRRFKSKPNVPRQTWHCSGSKKMRFRRPPNFKARPNTSVMAFLEWLQAGDSSLAIAAGILAALFFWWRWRAAAIEKQYQHLGITWTNEGDISGSEEFFIQVELKLSHGDLIGSLSSPQLEETLDVHVYPGWFRTRVEVSRFRGRGSESIATAFIRLQGNSNRLAWRTAKQHAEPSLPRQTLLWLSPL